MKGVPSSKFELWVIINFYRDVGNSKAKKIHALLSFEFLLLSKKPTVDRSTETEPVKKCNSCLFQR